MAKPEKGTRPIANSRIEFGEMVDGKNVVKTFEPGDIVTLDAAALKGLIACGAVQSESPAADAE